MYTSNLLLGRVLEEKLLDRKDPSELILETDSTYIPTIDAVFTSSSIDEEVSYDSDHDGTPDILKDKLNFGSEGDSTLYKIYVSADFLHRNFSLANAFSLDFEMPMGEMYDDDDEGILLEYDPFRFMDDEDDLFSSNYTSVTLSPKEVESITNLVDEDEFDLTDFETDEFGFDDDYEPEESIETSENS
ncbi:hypothetical protein KY339_02455 [Candidatus Woesearchaeota archaeon]|nr:hypothetical protein [Candidatus Woesearchaeota archaeon]